VAGKHGQVRLQDIALEVGVSVVTVAKVLNNTGGKNTRVSDRVAEKIRACERRLGYQPNQLARQLAGKSSDIIGVAMDSYAPAIFHTRLAMMEQVASSLGYRFLVGQAHDTIDKMVSFARDFESYNVAGIICLAHNYPGYSSCIASAYPADKTVFMEKPEGMARPCYVSLAVEDAFCDAVQHMAARGRTRPVLFLKGNLQTNYGMDLRQQGYLSGLAGSGLNYSRVIMLQPEDEACSLVLQERVRSLLCTDRPDAFIAANDHIAGALLRALLKLKVRVPEDVALMGFDNVDFAKLLTPSLTTFDDRSDVIAESLVTMLVALIQDPDLPIECRQKRVRPKLIVREST